MYRLIEENGKILAHGIDIKPGKPAIIGKIFNKPIFGLPGYPASALTIFNEFVAPLIRKLIGRKGNDTNYCQTGQRVRSEDEASFFRWDCPGMAYPVEKGSGAITTLSKRTGYRNSKGN